MVRAGADAWAQVLTEPGAREMDFAGKSLKGFVYVNASVLDSDDQLAYWVNRGRGFASGVPPK
jgi:hypothetical protein